MPYKGTVFWYRAKGKKYAAIVLDKVGRDPYYFVLLSEECLHADTWGDVMELPVYTAAWFSSCEMLAEMRMHIIAENISFDSFNGYAGGLILENRVIVNNCGQARTWKHEYRQLLFRERKISEQVRNVDYNKIAGTESLSVRILKKTGALSYFDKEKGLLFKENETNPREFENFDTFILTDGEQKTKIIQTY